MDAMSSRISENLRQIRKEKKLSLDSMAEQTGVSKSMLGQIERGESSPTVATLWKIATGCIFPLPPFWRAGRQKPSSSEGVRFPAFER